MLLAPCQRQKQRYSQIEREALAAARGCTRFESYLHGLTFILEADHKPLASLLGKKPLDTIPPRIQRLHMRLMRFTYDIIYVPGRDLHTADALSHAPTDPPDMELQSQSNLLLREVIQSIPIKDHKV